MQVLGSPPHEFPKPCYARRCATGRAALRGGYFEEVSAAGWLWPIAWGLLLQKRASVTSAVKGFLWTLCFWETLEVVVFFPVAQA